MKPRSDRPRDVLAFHGYAPTGVEIGEEGLRHASATYALVLLDASCRGRAA
jgi:hypothetical protein